MATRFVPVAHDTPLLFPPNLRDWVPADPLVHFLRDAVDGLDLRQVRVNTRGPGSEQYPPRLLRGLLIYSQATGIFGRRRLEQSTHDSVPVRLLTADTPPDHDTIGAFRRENQALLNESFGQLWPLAQQLQLLQFGQLTVAAAGTQVLAHASKHSAVSDARAGEQIALLEAEVRPLLAQAEPAAATPLQDGLTSPAEIARRQERHAALAQARAESESHAARARSAVQLAEHEAKLAVRAAKKERGEKVRGQEPQAPTPAPQPKDQYNFTDPESRIMKAGSGQHFAQSYHAPAGVEVESRLIVGQCVSPSPNDKQELVPTLAAMPAAAGPGAAGLVDRGYFSEKAVRPIERAADGTSTGTVVQAAAAKLGPHRSVADWEVKPEPETPAADASGIEVLRHRLKPTAGQALYKLRQQTVEPVFGIIKSVLGFRQFRLRGRAKAALEWTLVGLACNRKRLHRLGAGLKLAVQN